MKIRNLYESQLTLEHVKGGLDSYYQLTKAKRLAKADGHDFDELPEYHRGADQPHKEKYMALAKEVKEADDEVDTGPTWKDDLEAALDGYPESEHDTIKDGTCPECGGNGYSDGDEYDDDGEENSECNGMYDYDCDEGEIRDNTWADELKSKEPQAPKQPAPSKEQIMKILPRLHDDYVKSGRYNAFELGGILKQMYPELNKRLAGSYVADFLSNYQEETTEDVNISYNDSNTSKMSKEAYNKGGLQGLKAHLLKTKPQFAKQIEDEFISLAMMDATKLEDEIDDMINFMDQLGEGKSPHKKGTGKYKKHMAAMHAEDVTYANSTQKDLDDRIAKKDAELKRLKQLSGTDIEDHKKKMKANNDWKDTAVSEDESNDAAVSKIIAKALGDDSKWTEMSPQELFAELESTSPELADTISDIARMIYGVRLPEGRPYQDLGVGDAVMGADGKEYKFDANKQMFVATDTTNPSQHAVTTKFGADLKRRRTNLNSKLNRINRQT